MPAHINAVGLQSLITRHIASGGFVSASGRTQLHRVLLACYLSYSVVINLSSICFVWLELNGSPHLANHVLTELLSNLALCSR